MAFSESRQANTQAFRVLGTARRTRKLFNAPLAEAKLPLAISLLTETDQSRDVPLRDAKDGETYERVATVRDSAQSARNRFIHREITGGGILGYLEQVPRPVQPVSVISENEDGRRNLIGFRSQKDLASPLHTHAGAQRRGNLKNGGRMVESEYLLTSAILFGTAGVGL